MSAAPNRLGLETLTFLGMPPSEQIRLAAELGCAGVSIGLAKLPVELMGFTDPGIHPDWSLRDDPVLLRETLAALRDTGVRIWMGEGFSADADRDVQDFARDLDLMAELGARRIMAISTDPDVARAHDQLAKLADLAIARGVGLTLEFVPVFAIATLQDGIAAIEHVGRGRLSLIVDAMHFFRTGGTAAQLAALDPELIGHAQLCDAPLTSSEDYLVEAMFERMVPGEGGLPLGEWIAALPPDCPISLEVPRLAALQSGVTPREHAAALVAGARALGV
jgi:sugar phosphate isomerase/epimerase